jgi:hypothetical protein
MGTSGPGASYRLLRYSCQNMRTCRQQGDPIIAGPVLFELKVESVMRVGRWIWGCNDAARKFLNTAYERWARQLLGAELWRNAAAAQLELGWALCGEARVVFVVAMARARFWQDSRTVAGCLFAGLKGCEQSCWSTQSLSLLQVPYSALQLSVWGPPSAVLSSQASWLMLCQHRSLCRLRLGLLELGHSNKKHTRALPVQRVACNMISRCIYQHILCQCSKFSGPRDSFTLAGGCVDSSANVLACRPEHAAFWPLLGLAAAVEEKAEVFWKTAVL